MNARVIKADKSSNFPINIATYAISTDVLNKATVDDDLVVRKDHEMPISDVMKDLSPSSYQALSDLVKTGGAVTESYRK